MPSPIAHSSLAFLARSLIRRTGTGEISRGRWYALLVMVWFSLCAADIDFVLKAFVPGATLLRHGGATHSFAVAFIYAVGFASVGRFSIHISWLQLWMIGLVCYASHIALDALTWGGGVMMFWPLFDTRIVSPLPLFYGARHSQPWAWHLHLITLTTELAFAAVIWHVARRIDRWPTAGGRGFEQSHVSRIHA